MRNFVVLLTVLSSLVVPSSFGASCEIPGAPKSPTLIQCHYRDGWYMRRGASVECQNGHYYYRDDSDEGVLEKASLDHGRFVFRFNQFRTIQIDPHHLFNKGQLIEPNDGYYGERIHCRIYY